MQKGVFHATVNETDVEFKQGRLKLFEGFGGGLQLEGFALFNGSPVTAPDHQPRVTVWTRPGCPACRATIRTLERADVPLEVLDADACVQDLRALGMARLFVIQTTAPVTGVETYWSGHRPDLITEYVTEP